MPRSKLEVHVDILKALARYGPLKLTHIAYKANMNISVTKQCLIFSIQHNLVEGKTSSGKGVVYAITERGLIALKYFGELNCVFQTTEKEHKLPTLLLW